MFNDHLNKMQVSVFTCLFIANDPFKWDALIHAMASLNSPGYASPVLQVSLKYVRPFSIWLLSVTTYYCR